MTLIIQHENPAEYAPTVSYNHCGRMPWSGRHFSEFSGIEVVELLQFCEEEGHRQGLNDALYDRVGSREKSPFHHEFMGGFPEQAWHDAYWMGVQKNEDTTPEVIEAEIQKVLDSPDTSVWLRYALQSAAQRDGADAVNDAEYLHDLLMRRFNAYVLDGH